MEDRELLQKSAPEFERLAFTVLAIEASAQKMGISPSEMRKRLDKALAEYRKYQVKTLTQVEEDYLDSINALGKIAKRKRRQNGEQ